MTSLGIMLKVEQLDDFKANASTKKKKKAKKKVKAPTIETNIVGYSTEKARPKKDSKDPFMRYKDKGRGYVITATVTSLLPLCHSCSSPPSLQLHEVWIGCVVVGIGGCGGGPCFV